MSQRQHITPALLHKGSLITYIAPKTGRETCLGYLFDFTGRGLYDPNFGKVDVTPAEAQAHNACLGQAEIEGLDKNCQVGMHGTFYLTEKNERRAVRTWTGELVSQQFTIHGQVITFHRKGMTFRGRLQRDAQCFNFRRVA